MKAKYGAVEVPADLAKSNQVHQPRFADRIRVLPRRQRRTQGECPNNFNEQQQSNH
jgi:hypothetical protein